MVETVYEQFSAAAAASPHLAFLCYPKSEDRGYLSDGREYSYGESLETVDRLAARYDAAGYGPGHRIAMLFGNRPDHFWHLLALNRIGASAVPLNPAYLKHELHYGVEFAECALVVAAGERVDDLRQVCSQMEIPVAVVDVAVDTGPLPAPARHAAIVPAAGGAREALIIYTSGTTGKPKGCMISNTSCLAAGESYGTAGGLINFEVGADRLYIPLPTFHMNVSVYTLNTMTRLRNCIVLQDRFRASTWWPDIVSTGATCVHYMGIIPPLLVKSERSADESRHRVKFGQGAGVDPVVREAFEERFGFPLIEAWGMTETSRAIQNCREPRDPDGRAFGRVRPPLEVQIVDDDDKPLPFGTPGELIVRSSGSDPRHGFFSGYLKQPEETEKAWRNGWFHTGDIVRQREDGMLYFVDRKKNIIRRSGENIAAAEIEEALIDNPNVKSVAVIAVEDEMHDEEIMACIVLMSGAEATEETALSICRSVRDRLIRYKLPAWVSFVEEIPVTSTQKIQKSAIFPDGTDPRKDPRTIDTRHLKRRRD
ncbi:MAG: AMP-binding protein [Alphaproteobacteria bacterium]|nr:AMP-binding protein [Alphaproteobacteria bacterium]